MEASYTCTIHTNNPKNFYCSKCGEIFCHICSQSHKHSQISRIPSALVQKYDFLKYLGSGVTGKVFSCRSGFDDNEYAIKLVEIDNVDKSLVLEAKKEIEILQKINHQNIIRYYDNEYLEDDETFAIIMELGDSNLLDVIKNLTEEVSFAYFKQICSAIEYIHKNMGILIDLLRKSFVL